jgi:CubicO group peptidase (beta-lactamase class C family)
MSDAFVPARRLAEFPEAEGGLWSCVEDLARWLAAQMREDGGGRGGDQILSGATLKEMHRPRYLGDAAWTEAWCIAWYAKRRGETVEIYCTGLGLPPVLGLRVTIGGEEALVFSAGPVAGVPWLYQVNARVPATAPSGAAVPVVIRIGEVAGNPGALGIEP